MRRLINRVYLMMGIMKVMGKRNPIRLPIGTRLQFQHKNLWPRERTRCLGHPIYGFTPGAAGIFLDPLRARRRPNPFHPSPQSILRIRDCLKKESRNVDGNRSGRGGRVEGANGRNWIPLMAARDRFWLSQSPRNRNKV